MQEQPPETNFNQQEPGTDSRAFPVSGYLNIIAYERFSFGSEPGSANKIGNFGKFKAYPNSSIDIYIYKRLYRTASLSRSKESYAGTMR